MLPKARRLCLKRDFERVFAGGKSVQGKLFRLKFLKNSFGLNRFAVVVSAKVSKKAVVRNRIRRRAWSTISELDSNLGGSLDIVFIALTDAARADFPLIKSEINFFITRRLS